MAEHVEAEAVLGKDVCDEIAFVSQPVVHQFFRTEDEDRTVAQLVVLDDGKSGERLPKAHAIGENTAVVSLQLIDDAVGGVALEVEEFFPNAAFLIPRAVVRQYVRTDVFQELAEDVVEHQEVDALGGIFLIHGGDVLAELVGHVFEFLRVVPNLIE